MADILTKQISRREVLNEIMIGNLFRNALDEKNCVRYRDGVMKVENLIMKSKEMDQEDERQKSQIDWI